MFCLMFNVWSPLERLKTLLTSRLINIAVALRCILTFTHCIFALCLTGFLLFKDFCMNEIDEAVPQLKFYEEVSVPCPAN